MSGIDLIRQLCVAVLVVACFGCEVELNEKKIRCEEAGVVDTAHAWADRVVLTPAEDHEWFELLEEPFRSYGLPLFSTAELRERHGQFFDSETATDTHSEFALPTGKLSLSLDRDRSGSSVHEAWRLRFDPRPNTAVGEVINSEALTCAIRLRSQDFELVIVDRASGKPKVSVSVRGDAVQRLTWTNL